MATLQQVRDEIRVDLDFLRKDIKFLLTLAQQAFADSKDRIFSQGLKSDSAGIGTYADSTARSKKRRGRFTSDRINLRETEKLVDSYKVEPSGKDVVLGFEEIGRRTSNSKLVDILENRYGDIFGLTDQELSNIDLLIDQQLNQIFD